MHRPGESPKIHNVPLRGEDHLDQAQAELEGVPLVWSYTDGCYKSYNDLRHNELYKVYDEEEYQSIKRFKEKK